MAGVCTEDAWLLSATALSLVFFMAATAGAVPSAVADEFDREEGGMGFVAVDEAVLFKLAAERVPERDSAKVSWVTESLNGASYHISHLPKTPHRAVIGAALLLYP